MTWKILAGNFSGSRPRRFISGIAISSTFENLKGVEFHARGLVDLNVAQPFLLEHKALEPLGRIVSVKARRNEILFTAELCNTDCLAWPAELWPKIVSRELTRVSVGAVNLGPALDRSFERWSIHELSLVAESADLGARIVKCWSRAPVIYADSRPTETLHWKVL